jgi:hypothetical protein
VLQVIIVTMSVSVCVPLAAPCRAGNCVHCKDINWWLLLALLGVGVAFSLFLVYWKKSEVGVRGCFR